MPERVATIDSAGFGNEGGLRALLSRALGRNPLDAIGLFLLLIAAGAILANALYRQPGPHPAPIFSVKPRPVATEPAEGVVPPMPRARPVGVAAPKQESAAAHPRAEAVSEPQRAAVKSETPVPMPRPAARPDPIGELIAGPTARVTAVQRALNDYGFGPVKVTGVYGPETVAAVQKFERDRKMPVTGQISPRLLRELATLTGKPLE